MWHVIPTFCGMLKLSRVISLRCVGMHDLDPPVLRGMYIHTEVTMMETSGFFVLVFLRSNVPGYSKTATSKLSLLILFCFDLLAIKA